MKRVAAVLLVLAAIAGVLVFRTRMSAHAMPDLAEVRHGGPSSVSLVGVLTREQADGVGGFDGHVTCDGDGVAGAELSFTLGDEVASVLTDSSGAFAFRPTTLGTYELAGIAAKGYLPYVPSEGAVRLEARAGKVVTGLVFQLVAESSIVVTVVADAPLPGATVAVHTPGTLAVSGPRTGVTGEDGVVTLGAGVGDLVEASVDGYDTATHVVTRGDVSARRFELKLVRSTGARTIVDGVVIDDSGVPVDGAQVSLVRGEALLGETVTGADGAFSLGASSDPSLHVRASKVAYIVDEEPSSSHMTLRLRRGCVVTGRVTDVVGPPVASFTLVVRRVSGDGPPPTSPSVYDSDGRYALRGVGAGRYSLQIFAADYAPSSTEVVEVTNGCEAVAQNFRLGRGGTVYGRVVDAESGLPLQARVATEGASVEAMTSVRSMATAGPDGNFEVGGLPAGRRSLVADAEGHHSLMLAGIDVRDGERSGPVDFKLHAVAEGEAAHFELTGIGAVLSPGDGVLVIQSALPGGGAAAAGLARGDQITAIDGNDVRSMGFEDATQAIRGPENTTVSLEVTKASSKNVTLVVQRKVVH